jgi:hypothetical protein
MGKSVQFFAGMRKTDPIFGRNKPGKCPDSDTGDPVPEGIQKRDPKRDPICKFP